MSRRHGSLYIFKRRRFLHDLFLLPVNKWINKQINSLFSRCSLLFLMLLYHLSSPVVELMEPEDWTDNPGISSQPAPPSEQRRTGLTCIWRRRGSCQLMTTAGDKRRVFMETEMDFEIYMCTYTFMSMYVYVYIYTDIFLHLFYYLQTYLYIYMFKYIYIYICVKKPSRILIWKRFYTRKRSCCTDRIQNI